MLNRKNRLLIRILKNILIYRNHFNQCLVLSWFCIVYVCLWPKGFRALGNG